MELKDYLHYYIGQTCTFKYHNGITYPSILDHSLIWTMNGNPDNYSEFKLHLREISSLTDEEKKEVCKLDGIEDHIHFHIDFYILRTNPYVFHYLLSIGIDLFELIDNNNAIDKATL